MKSFALQKLPRQDHKGNSAICFVRNVKLLSAEMMTMYVVDSLRRTLVLKFGLKLQVNIGSKVIEQLKFS